MTAERENKIKYNGCVFMIIISSCEDLARSPVILVAFVNYKKQKPMAALGANISPLIRPRNPSSPPTIIIPSLTPPSHLRAAAAVEFDAGRPAGLTTTP